MRQFLKYEIKYNWKNFLLTYLLIIGSFILLLGFILLVKEVTTPSKFLIILYTNIIILVFGAMIASAVLFIVNLVKSIYNSVFTDEGYLTLSFPKTTDSLILSKLVANFIWGILYVLSVVIGLMFLYVSLIILFDLPVNELFDELYLFLYQIDFSWTAVFTIINVVIQSVLNFMLLFLSFAIINTGIAKKGKVVLGILMYSGFNYVLSMITSFASFASFGLALNTEGKIMFTSGAVFSKSFLSSGAITYVLDLTSFLLYSGLIVGSYILTRYILKNHLELE